MKAKYITAAMALLLVLGTVFAQSANPIVQQLTSGIGGILIVVAIIGIILGIIFFVKGYKKHDRSFPAQKGKRIGGGIMMAFGILLLFIGVVALIGYLALPWIVNSIVAPGTGISNYQSVINSCIAVSGISCTKPALSYTNSTGFIVLTMTQYSSLNWTTASIEFVNQSQEGTESSSGFNYNIPYRQIPNGLTTGQAANLVLPFAPYVASGSPMLGYLWVVYTSAGNSQPVVEQVATIAVS